MDNARRAGKKGARHMRSAVEKAVSAGYRLAAEKPEQGQCLVPRYG